MASKIRNLSAGKDKKTIELEGVEEIRVGIVVADYHSEITDKLLAGCKSTLMEHGILEENIFIVNVPGAFEIPFVAKILIVGERAVNAVIGLGCVIKGETPHNEYINQAVANAIMNLGLEEYKPVIYGILTPNTYEQALDRAGGTIWQ